MNASVPAVSIVLPAKNAERYLPGLFAAFRCQEGVPPPEVIVMDSMSTDGTRALCEKEPGWRVVPEPAFCHAETRNRGARAAAGDIVVFLSQDALPRDARWLSRLLEPFTDPAVAAAYSRQEPYPDASPMEAFFLAHRFPGGETLYRRREGERPIDFESAFFSNVSSAVRRELLLKHPFDASLIMSEDQQLSRDLQAAGHAVAYVPGSVVIHSHDYTLGEVFRRYFDSVYSLRQIYRAHGLGTSASIGLRYLRSECLHMVRRHPLQLPYYLLYTAAKSLATVLAHAAGSLPRSWVRRCSMHRYYWDRV